MRLYLAVAVLMLALVAYTEAQDDTVEQKLANLGQQFTEISKGLADKAKNTLETIHNSEFATNARSWFTDAYETLKAKAKDVIN